MTFGIDNPEGGLQQPLRKICLGKPSGEQGLMHFSIWDSNTYFFSNMILLFRGFYVFYWNQKKHKS